MSDDVLVEQLRNDLATALSDADDLRDDLAALKPAIRYVLETNRPRLVSDISTGYTPKSEHAINALLIEYERIWGEKP